MWYVSASWLHETAVVHKRGTSVESWPRNGGRGGKHKLNTISKPTCDWFPQAVFIISPHAFISQSETFYYPFHMLWMHKKNDLSSHKTSVLWWDTRVEGHWRIGTLIHPCQKPTLGDLALPQDYVYRFLEGRFAKKRKYLPGFFHRLSRFHTLAWRPAAQLAVSLVSI